MMALALRSMRAVRWRRGSSAPSAVCGADVGPRGDLLEPFGQGRVVAVMAGLNSAARSSMAGLNSAVRRSDMAVSGARGALRRWRRPCTPCFSGLPFAIARERDPAAAEQRVRKAIGAPPGDLDGTGLLPAAARRERLGSSGTGQPRPVIGGRLATIPAIGLGRSPKGILSARRSSNALTLSN
jgi:hypothetical protein